MEHISIATAKSHLSELVSRSAHGHERFVITRRERPVAALVSLEDLAIIEQHKARLGLASLTGKWKGFEEIEEALHDIDALRQQGGSGREVSL